MSDPAIGENNAFVFPTWFPTYLQPEAHRLYVKAVRLGFNWKISMLERLVSDPRMRRVWRELSEHKRDRNYRRTDICEHRAIPPVVLRPSVTNEEIQQIAIRELFCVAASVAEWFELLSERLPERAAELRADANRLQAGQPRKKCSALAKKLIVAAEAYEQAEQFKPFFHAHLVRAVAEIASFMEARFGSRKNTLTATLTSVALNLKVTPSNVREWAGRNRPTKRPTR
jgi:hypothetical protein